MGLGKIPLTSSEYASSWMRYMRCARAWPRQKGLSLHEPESPSASAAIKRHEAVAPDRVLVAPSEPELHVMTRYAFVQNVGTRITRIGLCKIPEHVRRRRRPTNAILVKSQRAGEVVKFGETSQVRDIRRNRPDGV